MSRADVFTVQSGWRVLLEDLGVAAGNVLRRASLPGDLFARQTATLSTAEYFRLWRALEEETAGAPVPLPLRIGHALSLEAFDPALFAALCSADLNTAFGRIARYKRLIAPMSLQVEVRERETVLALEWLDHSAEPPVALVAAELVFCIQLARLATRVTIRPLAVTTPRPPDEVAEYAAYFGVPVSEGEAHAVVFSATDAVRPFLTANEKMWRFFEPTLDKRLLELDRAATVSERVHSALLELLPSGSASIEAVSRRLGVSIRTLQRRLQEEGGNFQVTLNRTREELARHYLEHSAMSGAEISFLLGFEDPSSFARAFKSWTGTTPERARAELFGSRR